MTLIRRFGWWILINNFFWMSLCIYDLANERGDVLTRDRRNLLEIMVLLTGVVAEVRRWRIAPVLNVGYYAVMGLWILGYDLSDVFYPIPEPGGTALVVLLIGFPMLLVAVVNWRIYRSRKLEIAVT